MKLAAAYISRKEAKCPVIRSHPVPLLQQKKIARTKPPVPATVTKAGHGTVVAKKYDSMSSAAIIIQFVYSLCPICLWLNVPAILRRN